MPEMNNMKAGNQIYEVADSKARGVPLTWAQYQALSYEEQHNGTAYYITDMDAVYPVDHELNANSRNAVANDIVTQHILAMENVTGAKNLLPFDLNAIKDVNGGGIWDGNSYTYEGITYQFQLNSKRQLVEVDISGTATANGSYVRYHRFTSEFCLNGKDVVLSGCPSGGADSTYFIEGYRIAGTQSTSDNRRDYGSGISFTWNNDSSSVQPDIYIAIAENYAIQGTIAFKPMIRPAGTDPTYVPYSMTNRELTERVNGESTHVSSCYFFKHPDGTIAVSGLAVLPMTVPEGFRPTDASYAVAQGYNGATQRYLTFYPDGNVMAGDLGDKTGSYFVSCTYK